MMYCLCEKQGKPISGEVDKGAMIVMMLQVSNELPEEFSIVNKLLKLEKELKINPIESSLDEDIKSRSEILGALEAKTVFYSDQKWERLLDLKEI